MVETKKRRAIDNHLMYDAFISYKWKDKKAALRIQKNLANYRLPAQLHTIPQSERLWLIRVDKGELPPIGSEEGAENGLFEEIKTLIAQSTFFIAIGSKNARYSPMYLDFELQYFLETHNNDYTKVILFNIDEQVKNPEEECFSSDIQALCKKHRIYSISVKSHGWQHALRKLATYMVDSLIDSRYTYLYYAFISYKREDKESALYLHKCIENYRLPVPLCKKYNRPQRLCPICIDLNELVSGSLNEELKRLISKSEYFISICSRHSRLDPDYVDLELRYFLETHDGDYTKVIPFIIDEHAENPEEDCFSPSLQALCNEHKTIGANIKDHGWQPALLKVIAYMHGLLPAEITHWSFVQRKKNALFPVISAAIFLCLFLFGASYWWQHIAVHEAYYTGCVFENNVARGIDRIDKDDLSQYSRYYLFKTKDGKVQSYEYLSYTGRLVPLDDEATVLNMNASKADFIYAGNSLDVLYQAKYYDHNGRILTCCQYSADGTHVVLLQDENSGIPAFVSEYPGNIELFSGRTNVTRYVQAFDEYGRVSRRHYAYGEYYTFISDGNGVCGYDLSYDDVGQLAKVACFKNIDASVYGDSISYVYYKQPARLASMAYLDADSTLQFNANGWAKKEYSWNKRNAIEAISYKDKNGMPVLCTSGYATVKMTYDGNMLAEEAYFDTNDTPITTANGHVRETFKINDQGEISSVRYWDAEGYAVMDASSGTYGYEMERTDVNSYRIWYVDQNGQPMLNNSGYAYAYVTTDELGYVLKQEYRDTSNSLYTKRPAFETYTYDPVYHNILEHRYFDENGFPTIGELDYAALISEYAPQGFEAQRTYLDENGNLYTGYREFAKVVSILEPTYTTQVHMYYDANNKPTGIIGYEETRDESGQLTDFCYLDENAQPYLNTDKGYAAIHWDFDNLGNICAIQYLNDKLQPVMVDGYASMFVGYDAVGNITSHEYYGANSQPVINPSKGYAIMLCEYEDGHLVNVIYGNADGAPMLNEQAGYAEMQCTYQDAHLVETKFFDADGFPMINEQAGYACELRTYDEAGHLTEVYYLDPQGKAMNNPLKGYAKVEFIYDENGKAIDMKRFNVKSSN